MALSEQTRSELRAIREGVELPGEYTQFMVRWIAFNRAYNELRRDDDETYRVMGLGDDMQVHWPEIIGPAASLVSMECIGGEHIPQQTLLRPNRWVKSATVFLRRSLRIKPGYPDCAKDPKFCRANKVAICWPVQADPWERTEMAALLRLIYQVRCNLFHGDRRLMTPDVQTNRDRELLAVSNHILNEMFGWLC
jgi:hypothetical protein